MSVTSLEKFNKQFETGEPRTVSEILRLSREGKFDFYFPATEQPDTATLIDRVESCLPQLYEVVKSPYIILKSEYREVRTELAGNISPQGIQMTVKDPKLWKKKGDQLRPETIYAKTYEDEYNTYENRLIKALIDRILRFLQLPMDYAKDGVKNLYEAYFQSASLNKLDLIKLMDADLFKSSDKRSFTDYKKLFYLRGKITQLRNSAFYKIMSQVTPFSGELQSTNLVVHNANYNACFRLWLFLDQFNAGLSLLSAEQIKSVYSAFITLGMADIYREIGFRVVKDFVIKKIDERFEIKNLVLENEIFTVILEADEEKVKALVQCRKVKTQQSTVIELHTDLAEPYGKDNQFIVSLYKTNYSDRAACVVPGNKNSFKDLQSIVRCTVFTLEAEKDIYDKICLICGSTMVEDKGVFLQCENCGAVYSFLDENTVWLNQFHVLDNGKNDK